MDTNDSIKHHYGPGMAAFVAGEKPPSSETTRRPRKHKKTGDTSESDWDVEGTVSNAEPAEATTTEPPGDKKPALTGEAAREDQLNKLTDESIKRQKEEEAASGGNPANLVPDVDEQFPNDLAKCLEIVLERQTTVETLPAQTKRKERIAAQKALDRIRKHTFALQQVPQTHAPYNDHLEGQRQSDRSKQLLNADRERLRHRVASRNH